MRRERLNDVAGLAILTALVGLAQWMAFVAA